MKRFLNIASLVVAGLLLSAYSASAQVTTANHVGWDQSAQDLATANALTFKYYPDGASTGSPLTNVTCVGTTSPFQCVTLIPAFTPTTHTLTVSANNIAGESLKSNTISFTFVVVPVAPANLHIAEARLHPYTGRINFLS